MCIIQRGVDKIINTAHHLNYHFSTKTNEGSIYCRTVVLDCSSFHRVYQLSECSHSVRQVTFTGVKMKKYSWLIWALVKASFCSWSTKNSWQSNVNICLLLFHKPFCVVFLFFIGSFVLVLVLKEDWASSSGSTLIWCSMESKKSKRLRINRAKCVWFHTHRVQHLGSNVQTA